MIGGKHDDLLCTLYCGCDSISLSVGGDWLVDVVITPVDWL